MSAEDDQTLDPLMETSQLRYQLESKSKLVDAGATKTRIMTLINDNSMVALYDSCCVLLKWGVDASLRAKLVASAAKTRAEHEVELAAAHEHHGDVEVMEVELKMAQHLAKTDTKEKASAALKAVSELKSSSTGQKIDVVLETIRLGFFWSDSELIKLNIAEADRLLELGGDWDRRNRLKVYRALFAMMSRDFVAAAEDFQSAVATFTSYELCTYSTFVFYTVITSIAALERTEFKKKIVDAPEVLSVIHENPACERFVNALYNCEYKALFQSLCTVYDQIAADRYLSVHRDWFVREVRVLAYRQFLESYKSVTLKSMSTSFGVSIKFLDSELAHFISAGRLNAKIDKTSGVIETNRPLHSNAQYQAVIKQGDLLLNRVQMLSRAINV